MFAKRDYYQMMFNTFSSDMKKTWQTINDTRNRSKKPISFLSCLNYQMEQQFRIRK